jgi:hypothetical protein
MNNLAILQALAFEPRKGFAELDARPRYWWPLLLLVITQVAVTVWYTSFVDLEWLVDTQLHQSARASSMTDEEIARLASQMASQRGLRVVIGGVGTALVLPIVLLVTALYYTLAAKVTGVERSFRHWFALACWSTVPTVIALLPAAIALLTATSNQVPQEALQPLSLNQLFFGREPGDPGYSVLANINLFQFVSVYLAAMGLKVWSRRSWTYSIVVAALPLVLIYGIWAFISLR